MKYYIHYITTYASVNNKGKELQEFVLKFKDCLVTDERSLNNIKEEIKKKMEELNAKYPRTQPFVFSEHSRQWSVSPENKYNDNHVFILGFSVVRSTYTYPNAAGIAQQMFFITSGELQNLKGGDHE